MKKIKLGKYIHYKGGEYEVLGVVWDTEEKTEKVLYKALYDIPKLGGSDVLFVRPFGMFFSDIEFEGEKIKRFSFIK